MKRFILATLALLGIGLGIGFVAKTATLPKQRAALTIEFRERVVAASTGKVRERRWLIAERADRSTVKVNLDKPLRDREIKFAREGKIVMVSDELRAISTTTLQHAFHDQPYDPTCMTHPKLVKEIYQVIGTGSFLGMQVVKHASEIAGNRYELWEAPDCNCEPIYRKIIWKNADGTIRGTTEQVATSIMFGEPDAALFQIPNYPEEPLSIIVDPLGAAGGAERLNRADRLYYESQANRPK